MQNRQSVNTVVRENVLMIGQYSGKSTVLDQFAIDNMTVKLIEAGITAVTFKNCAIDGTQLAHLIRNASLTKVVLECCPFDDNAAVQLAEQLKTPSRLQTLGIDNCSIDDRGVIALLTAIKIQPHINIELGSNENVTDIGHDALKKYNERDNVPKLADIAAFAVANFASQDKVIYKLGKYFLPQDAKQLVNDCMITQRKQYKI